MEDDEVFAGVSDAMVFEMLAELAPNSLGVEKKDRDSYQSSMVDMIGSALQTEIEKLKKALATADSANAEADGKVKAKTAEEEALKA